MEYNEVLDRLRDLVRVDIDATRAYAVFLEHLEDAQSREKVSRFLKDHELHVMELTSMITSIEGETAPSRAEQAQGFFIEGFRAPAEGSSLEEAIQAMLHNERLLLSTYKEVVAVHEMPPEFHMVIDRYYKQEQKHLSYLEELLEREEVERAGAT